MKTDLPPSPHNDPQQSGWPMIARSEAKGYRWVPLSPKQSAFVVLIALFGSLHATAQLPACDATGRQTVARRWDVVLGHEWEMVRDCRHPEWPAHALAVKELLPITARTPASTAAPVAVPAPFIVHAGDIVTLWRQAAFLRIEMTGTAEQAARAGERVAVRVNRNRDDGAQTVEHIEGTVRAAGNVEMTQ